MVVLNTADQTEMDIYESSQRAEEVTGATTESVAHSNALASSVNDFLNSPDYLEVVDENKLYEDKARIKKLRDLEENLITMDRLCKEYILDPDIIKENSGVYQNNRRLLKQNITNFKNSKKISAILTFLYDNGGISSIVFLYNKNPTNEEYYYKPHVIGDLPYDDRGNLNYPDSVENYDTFYIDKEINVVKKIVNIIYDMLLEPNDVPKDLYNDLNAILPKLNDDSELPPSSVKYNIIAKNEFIKSIKLSANTSSNEMIINTTKGNVIKLGNLMDDIPSYEYMVKDGNKTIGGWYEEYSSVLNNPSKSSEWKPASITNSEEHKKASEAVDIFLDRLGRDKHILVGAYRYQDGPYSICRKEEGGSCFFWLDHTQWLDNVWYRDNWKEPNDSGSERAAHIWGIRENSTNLRTLNDIKDDTKGAILLKRSKLNNTVTFESPDVDSTKQIVEIRLNTIDENSIKNLTNDKFVITERKTQIEDESDSKFRSPLTDTTDIGELLEKKLTEICTNSYKTDNQGNPSITEQVAELGNSINGIERNINSRIDSAQKIKGLGPEPFSNMYEGSNNFKMSLFCLIIYAIIIFLIFKKINNSYLKNILILITIILFIIIINSNNSNNSNNIENFTSNLNKNILLDSINNIALKVKDSYSYY